jgi:tRNA A37 threonylcarbamoyltransferase TsaD
MKILGIETSCDETAAAVVEDGYKLLSKRRLARRLRRRSAGNCRQEPLGSYHPCH